MKKQFKHIFFEFMEKMRFKYRISIINENTLEEEWHTLLSRFNVLLFLSSFFLTTFILLTLIIFSTPLRHYLPGYQDSGNRVAVIQQAIRTDSLSREMEYMENYLTAMKDNIAGNPKVDDRAKKDSAAPKEQTTAFMAKSKRESEFVNKYEETEKYNLKETESAPQGKTYVFFRPVTGVVASTYDPKEGKYGISIITSPQETVMSVLEGRVINAAFTFDYGWIISVQHDDDYISIYKNNTKLLKRIGDYVKAGESIAITGNEDGKNNVKYFYFELWKKGQPINPQDVITFRF